MPLENPEAIGVALPDRESLIFWTDIPENEFYSSATIERIATLLALSSAQTVLAPTPADPSFHAATLGMAAREAARRTEGVAQLIFFNSTPEVHAEEPIVPHAQRNVSKRDESALEAKPTANVALENSRPGLPLFEKYVLHHQHQLITPYSGLALACVGVRLSPDKTRPLVSIITRTTNRAELADALDSIAAQTYGNIEVMLVDAAGVGARAPHDHCGPFPLRFISRGKPLGRSAAANAGLESAEGDFILFLDDDDWIYPDHIESLVKTVSGSASRAAYSETVCLTRNENNSWQVLGHYAKDYDPALLLVDNYLPIHSVLFEQSLVKDGICFDENLDFYEDWDFWLQLSRSTEFAQTRRLTAVYRISPTSGFGQRNDDAAAPSAYRQVIMKWRSRWTTGELEAIARDAASRRRVRREPARSKPSSGVMALRSLLVRNRVLEQTVAQQQEELIRSQDKLTAQAEQLRSLSAANSKLQIWASALQDQGNALKREITEQRNQCFSERRVRNASRYSHAQLARMLDSLQTSSYWRLTSPVRAIDQRWPFLLKPLSSSVRAAWWAATLRLPRRLRVRRMANVILRHGLFDRDWYVAHYPDVVLRGLNPLLHWIIGGWKEGRWPNSLFDTNWYLAEHPELLAQEINPLEHFLAGYKTGQCDPNPLFHCHWYSREYTDVADAGVNPLTHFLDSGAREGRNPNPLFDTRWYLEQNPDVAGSGMNPLAHFLSAGAEEGRDPCPYFDSDWYLAQNPDVAQAEINPLAHYFWAGAAEGRAPSDGFDPALYAERHPEVRRDKLNPLVHFLEGRRQRLERLVGREPECGMRTGSLLNLYDEMLQAAQREPKATTYVPEAGGAVDPSNLALRVIAFYLPQFHPIPENDAWWGKGFTEWTNVTKAVPQFEGHYQPRLPEALGFYDLRLKEVQKAQIELAKKYGVYGFCYHHYWFAGKRLLERPLQQMLEDPSLDFPFCICWANENWTRRWDGCEEEVLLGQDHSVEDDLAFIAELEPALRDPRYIHVDGRPLLIVYRPQLFPDPAATAQHWRDYLLNRGMPDPYLVNVWSFPEAVDPRSIGFDAAVEFPPHQYPCAEVGGTLRRLNEAFDGRVCDYNACVEHAERTRYQRRPFDLFPGVMTAWDNTPRRLEHGTVYANASPDAYKRWMATAADRALDFEHTDMRMVFVNAWNEWAEGTYLEPDRRYGYAYLQATRDVLEMLREEHRARTGASTTVVQSESTTPRLLLIGHDAHRHGAQLLALNLARLLAGQFGYNLRIWLLEGGELLPEFRQVAEVNVLSQGLDEVESALRELVAEGFDSAITNTVVTGHLVPELKAAGFKVLSLVHEMPAFIAERALQDRARALAASADHIVFAADTVRRGFASVAEFPEDKVRIIPQGIYQSLTPEPDARAAVESELGLPPDATLVLNVGYGDERKGFDWFLDCARRVADADPRFHFLWVGNLALDVQEQFEHERRRGRLVTNLHHVPFTDRIARYFAAADVFLLTSREDPFPSVVLEAWASGLPTVAFEGSGGHCELLQDTPALGALAAPMGDVNALAAALKGTAAQDLAAPERRTERARLATDRFDFADYGWALLRQLDPTLRSVSVVVPNYNYARHLRERLESIFSQTHPVYELIVLDDASTDDSISVVRDVCGQHRRRIKFIENPENSGSVFKQWAKGVREASGEFVWIAEADDLAKPDFLTRLVSAMAARDEPLFAFSDSAQIDYTGASLGSSYAAYCNEYTDLDFSADFTLPAQQFLAQAIGVKNNVLNVSAALFSRAAIAQALAKVEAELADWTIAGDWRLYIELCKQPGEVAYLADALNTHRRHAASVVGSNKLQAHIDEISRIHRIVAAATLGNDAALTRQKEYVQSLTQRARAEGRNVSSASGPA